MDEVLLTLLDAAVALAALVTAIAVPVALAVYWPWLRAVGRRAHRWICDAIGGGWSWGG